MFFDISVMRTVQPRRAALTQSTTRGPSSGFDLTFDSHVRLYDLSIVEIFTGIKSYIKLWLYSYNTQPSTLAWRGIYPFQQVNCHFNLCTWMRKALKNHVLDLFFSSPLLPPSEAHLPKSNNDLCAHVFRRPPGAFARLRIVIRGAQSCSSQWAGILLATMETYNMPGNRGNHRGGDKTHGN